jgi:ATPase subunit of ABC transporter with duplicated ATPase domains
VIEVNNIKKVYDNKILFENLSFVIPPSSVVGIIGPNGAGKTTLFEIIMGYEKPDGGTVIIGDTVKISYVDQLHTPIDPEKTIWEIVSEGNENIQLGNRLVNSRAYLAKFNFSGAEQNKK